MKKKSKVVMCAIFICTLIFAAFHPTPKVTVKAEGICCDEKGSICIIGTKSYSGKYYESSGTCDS